MRGACGRQRFGRIGIPHRSADGLAVEVRTSDHASAVLCEGSVASYHASGAHNRFRKYSRQAAGKDGWSLAFSSSG
jgi:hypothetical protein